VSGLNPGGLNFSRGSWLCDWPWPIAPGAHLVIQAREDLFRHGRYGPATHA